MAQDRLVFKPELIDRLGVSYPTILKFVREGRLPRGRVIGDRIAWTEKEVETFLANLPRQKFRSDLKRRQA